MWHLFLYCRTFSEINKPLDLYNKCKELCENLGEDLIKDEIAVS